MLLQPRHHPIISQLFSILRSSIAAGDLRLGQCAHCRILTSGLASKHFLSNNLITMYAKCNSLPFARHVFDQISNPEVVSWNSILATYSLSPDPLHHFDGFRLFLEMRSSAIPPSRLTLAPVLKICLQLGLLPASETIHGYAMKIGLDLDTFVSGALVNIYAKFGCIENARKLFGEMPDRDVVMWNVMIKAYYQLGFEREVFSLFQSLHRSSLRPDDVTMRCVLGGCSEKDSIEQAHAFAIKTCLSEEKSDVIVWNKRMSGFVQDGEYGLVLKCFMEMARRNVKFDNVTFVILLSAVASENVMEVGEQVHNLVVKLGFDFDVSVGNSLISMYAKSGCLHHMQQVFDEMKEMDLISWNSVISSYTQSGFGEETAELFLSMLRDGVCPDHFTLASIFRACAVILSGSLLAKQVHVQALKAGLLADIFVLTSLIDVYAKHHNMQDAEYLFNDMNVYDVASSNAMISGYVTNCQNTKALTLFASMKKCGERLNDFSLATALKACSCLVGLEQGKQLHADALKLGFDSDLCVSSGILDMYLKCGNLRDASVVFGKISEPDEVAWTAMISGCAENGDDERALSLYHQMRQSGVLPDEFTFATLIKACSCLVALEHGKQIHANVVKFGLVSDTFVGTSIIDMYAKCGGIEESYQLFKRIDVRNIAMWNAMVVGFAQHGNAEKALDFFQTMRQLGVQPDRITFIGVLSACAHSGLVFEAYMYFNSMCKDYGIQPEIEHYSCLVDVLGRAGLVGEAENVIKAMPFEASASMYRVLLGACRIKGDADIGKQAATHLLQIEPSDSSAYVLLSNIYAAANRWDDAANARKMMKTRKVKKDPGSSWIEIKNKVHLFAVDDRTHPEAEAIYRNVENLMKRIGDEGYVLDTDFVFSM